MLKKIKAIALPAGLVALGVIVATRLIGPLHDFVWGPTGWVEKTRTKQ